MVIKLVIVEPPVLAKQLKPVNLVICEMKHFLLKQNNDHLHTKRDLNMMHDKSTVRLT